jgi:CheY-like chemotaxis protein
VTDARRRVLIIDDEQFVVRAYARILGRDNDVTTISSANEALRRIRSGESWDVILCDLQMPELDGVEFEERLRGARPELSERLAFITGGAFTQRIQAFLGRNTRPVIEKPVSPDGLRALVARLAPR